MEKLSIPCCPPPPLPKCTTLSAHFQLNTIYRNFFSLCTYRFLLGIGNGDVQLFRYEGKKKFFPHQCLKKHTSSVSQVHFPKFHPNEWLVSAGNDCKIVLWNLKTGTYNGTSGSANQHKKDTATASVVSEVEHVSKPNWITSTILGENIFVADQTNEISVYHVV